MARQRAGKRTRVAVFPGQYASLGDIVDFVTAAARAAGFETRDVQAVQLAVDEACSNIIEHAYGGERRGDIECRCCIDGDALITTLTDRGAPFDFDAVPEPDLDAALDERAEGGLGVFIMRRLMDEIHHVFTPGVGNTLTLIKRRGKAD